ncbi:MAG: hypothetical protein HY720_29655 [Planctomycetes bacterium]|nr:hypothetical protein [Planctomycetota bacterium]
MSLEALGTAIQLERGRSLRRPSPGGSAPRTAGDAQTSSVPVDVEFEREAELRARIAEVRRAETRSRIAAHHLTRIHDFRRVLEDADKRAARALSLAERASGEIPDAERAELADQARELLAATPPIPGPGGLEEPPREIDLTTPKGARTLAEELAQFRGRAGRSLGRLDRMREAVLASVSDLAAERRRLRGIPNGRPSPLELRSRVEEVRTRILADPGGASRAQANLPRGLVLSLLRGA